MSVVTVLAMLLLFFTEFTMYLTTGTVNHLAVDVDAGSTFFQSSVSISFHRVACAGESTASLLLCGVRCHVVWCHAVRCWCCALPTTLPFCLPLLASPFTSPDLELGLHDSKGRELPGATMDVKKSEWVAPDQDKTAPAAGCTMDADLTIPRVAGKIFFTSKGGGHAPTLPNKRINVGTAFSCA